LTIWSLVSSQLTGDHFMLLMKKVEESSTTTSNYA